MPTNLIDYAWAQIPAPAIKSAGYIAVMRYLGGSARLTPIERDNLFAVDLGIGLVWETAADEAEHPERGQGDAVSANAEADGLGYPATLPIFFADDQNDANVDKELDYFQWVRANSRRPVGVYSGGNVVKAVMEAEFAEYGWAVETWFPDAGANPNLIQLANSKSPIIPGWEEQYDSNILVRSFPLWGISDDKPVQPTTRRQGDDLMWCASVLDKQWVDVWYNGIIVKGFHNEGPFGIGAEFDQYITMGVPYTVYKTEAEYNTPRTQLGQASGVIPKSKP